MVREGKGSFLALLRMGAEVTTFKTRNLMKTTRVQSRVVALVITIVLLLPVTSAQAGGPPKTGNKGDDRRSVEVTFTKWITSFPLMEGFVGGDVVGNFAGEVLDAKPPPPEHYFHSLGRGSL